MRNRLGPLILMSLGLSTFPVQALHLVEDRGHYLIMNDTDRLIEETPVNSWAEYRQVVNAIEDGYLAVHPDNSRILVLLFAPPFDMGGGYHRPLANEVHGIGHAHWGSTVYSQGINGPDYYDNQGIWDGTPGTSIQGIAYFGDWRTFGGTGGLDRDRLKSFLSHEVGHSWLSFAWYRDGGGADRMNLLDWEQTHWSVYVDSGHSGAAGARSLLGGQDWREIADGVFETEFPEGGTHPLDGFSDLDLYLLGALAAEQVDPFLVIENPTACTWQGVPVECEDPLNANLFPPFADPNPPFKYVVEGQSRMVSIEDIVAQEGPRIPAFDEDASELPVTFLVVKRPETTIPEDEKLIIEDLVVDAVDLWNDMTRGLLPMINRSTLADPTPGTGAFVCVEDTNTLCLAGGRFQVRVTWRVQDDEGLARTVDAGTDNSGLLWFFDAGNWELLVKVLDGCQVNGHFWVFSAATTDVEYTLTVTDSTNGESQRYMNQAGQSAPAVTDTSAFECQPPP